MDARLAAAPPALPSVAPPTPMPGLGRRAWLLAEMLALFVVLPWFVVDVARALGLRVIFLLGLLLPLILLLLVIDRGFSFRAAFHTNARWRDLAAVLALFIPLGALATFAVYLIFPGRFLSLPRYNPQLWTMIMTFYPILSAASQELIYRVFFFRRYEILFGGSTALLILVNAVLFGWGHIAFGSWITVAITGGAGLLFAWRYHRTRAFWPVWLEHSLWGDLAFTIGLGAFLYSRT